MQTVTRFSQDEDSFRFLVCTQLLGRGPDFERLRLVVNFDMPRNIVDYVRTLLDETDFWIVRGIKHCFHTTCLKNAALSAAQGRDVPSLLSVCGGHRCVEI